MKAYEFQTLINQGVVEIPHNYLAQLENQQKVRVIILTEDDNYPQSSSTGKLSEVLLLPELNDDEDLFPRDPDPGREITL
jgi:hypothetical protein